MSDSNDICRNLQNLFDNFPNHCQVEGTALFTWSVTGFGVGQLYFYIGEDGMTHCHNETMSKERVKEIMNILIDECVFK